MVKTDLESPSNISSNAKARTNAIESEIRNMIISGKIKHGDPFPPERQLAAQLGVSRNTVREAYNSLESLGIIQKKHGSGRYLVEEKNTLNRVFSTRQLVEKYTRTELLETRRALETSIAALAAVHATRQDKLLLQENIREMTLLSNSPGEPNPEDFNKLDYQFHYYLAVISNNSILREMIEALRVMIMETAYSIPNISHAPSEALHWHTIIMEAICDNDPAKARDAMASHLDSIELLYREMSR